MLIIFAFRSYYVITVSPRLFSAAAGYLDIYASDTPQTIVREYQ
jgi:hypothetical protein